MAHGPRSRAPAPRFPAAAAALALLAALLCLLGGASAPASAALPGAPLLPPLLRLSGAPPASAAAIAEISSRQVIVKFRDEAGVRLREGGPASAAGTGLAVLEQTLRAAGAPALSRLFSEPEAQLDLDRLTLEAQSGWALADLNGYYRIAVASGQAQGLAAALTRLPLVEAAYVAPVVVPAAASPSFVGLQTYRRAAPDGIDADFAATFPGARGDKVKVADIEFSWNKAHEDLTRTAQSGVRISVGTPSDPFADDNHGTAVMGELFADANGFGTTGLVPSATPRFVNAYDQATGFVLPDAINKARQSLTRGDVMVIPLQLYGVYFYDDYLPVEWDPATYDAIRAATAAGIVVVEAAGNGYQDLDDAATYGSPFPRGKPDSGAILAGAGGTANCPPVLPRARMYFSNYGARVNVQGVGACVATTGYGDLAGDSKNTWYTGAFNGTSSASPMVAAAAAALESAYKTLNGGKVLTPVQVRDILMQTGTPQNLGPGTAQGRVGPLPDLARALQKADLTPPSAPTNLTAAIGAGGKPLLRWTASTDNVRADYQVFRDGALLSQVAGASSPQYEDGTAPAGATVRYTVRAVDGAGNVSAFSNAATVSIPAPARLFADDFELGNLSRWTSVKGPVVQTQVVFAGRFAARATASGAASSAYAVLATPQTELYVRSRVRAISQGSNSAHLMRLRTASGTSLASVYRSSDGFLSVRNNPTGGSVKSATKIALNTWYDVQLHARVGSGSSLIEVWLNGARIGALTRTDSLGTTPIGRLQIGDDVTPRSFDLAFDDVAADRGFITP